jgi:ABC-type multidrug transport system permease subunit
MYFMTLAMRAGLSGAVIGLLGGALAYLSGGTGEALEGRFLMIAALTMPASLPFIWLAEIWPSDITTWMVVLGAPALECFLVGQLIGNVVLWRRASSRPAA